METFRTLKNESLYWELCFIVFYLCSTTKLRLGSILSLRRDCIVEVNVELNAGTVKFFSKTSDRNMDTDSIPLNCINFINQALELTQDIAQNTRDYHKKYIFIMKSRKNINRSNYCNTIFLGSQYNSAFTTVLQMAGLEKKYTPYQVRHTRKNKVYEEANKSEKTELEINEMLGGSLQVNLKHYIKFKNTELYVEAFTGVIISNVDINGKIISDDIELDKLTHTTKALGGCDVPVCKANIDNTYLTKEDEIYKCLICPSFVTCKSRVQAFKAEIVNMKNIYASSTSEDARVFYETMLKLLGAFYKNMLDLNIEGDTN